MTSLLALSLLSSNPLIDLIVIMAILLLCLVLWAWMDLSHHFNEYLPRRK